MAQAATAAAMTPTVVEELHQLVQLHVHDHAACFAVLGDANSHLLAAHSRTRGILRTPTTDRRARRPNDACCSLLVQRRRVRHHVDGAQWRWPPPSVHASLMSGERVEVVAVTAPHGRSVFLDLQNLSLIHISEPTRRT